MTFNSLNRFATSSTRTAPGGQDRAGQPAAPAAADDYVDLPAVESTVERVAPLVASGPGALDVTGSALVQAVQGSSHLAGFSRDDLSSLADGLDRYEATVDTAESTTAAAARFIRAMLAERQQNVAQSAPIVEAGRTETLPVNADGLSTINLYRPSAALGSQADALFAGTIGSYEDGKLTFDPVLARMSSDLGDVSAIEVAPTDILTFQLAPSAAAGLRATLLEQYRSRIIALAEPVAKRAQRQAMGGASLAAQVLAQKMETFDSVAKTEIARLAGAQLWNVPVRMSILASRQIDPEYPEEDYVAFDKREDSTEVAMGDGAVSLGSYADAIVAAAAAREESAVPPADGEEEPGIEGEQRPVSLETAMYRLVMESQEAQHGPVYAVVSANVPVIASNAEDAQAVVSKIVDTRLFDFIDTNRVMPVETVRFEQEDRPAPRG